MSIFDGYRHEDPDRLEPGDYRCVITEVKEAASKSTGRPMLVVTVKPNGSNMKINQYIVKNDYFNRNLTALYDSFGIREGDTDLAGWVGAMGAAKLEEDDKGYLRVRYFIARDRQENLAPWQGEVPARQTVSHAYTEVGEDDDLPF